MRLVFHAQAVLPVSGSNTPTLRVPLLPACASATDGTASSSAPTSVARRRFMLILPVAAAFRSARRTHLARRSRESLFGRPRDHGRVADRGEEITGDVVAVSHHDPGHAGLVGELCNVTHRTRADGQHDPVAGGMAYDALPAAAQNTVAFDRYDRHIRHDL